MKIKNIEVKGDLVLAPMAGYSDVGLRSLAVKYGASFCVTEMVSAKALIMGNKKTLDLLETENNEKIKVVQLFGHNPQDFINALKLDCLKKFDIIDINMGCPVSKIVKNNEGSSLMKNLPLAKSIIEACVGATDKPVSVKFRRGYNTENCVEFAKMCESAGASLITVHGRFATQGYSGYSDLDAIKKVKEAVNIPVCASGDILDRESYLKVKEYTCCDLFMVGRGAMGRPQIFAEICGKKVNESSLEIMSEHIKILQKHNIFNLSAFRKQASGYVRSLKNAKVLREIIFTANSIEELEKIREI